MLRILLLAPASNPDGITGPLIEVFPWRSPGPTPHSHVRHSSRGRGAPCAANSPSFRAIEVISPSWLDRIYSWSFRWIFKNNYRSQVLTAFNYIFCVAFEWRAWRQTRSRIKAGEFDVVAAPLAYFVGLAKLLFFLPARSHSVCDRADQRWFAMAGGFQASREAKGMDLQPEEFLPLSAFRPINLSRCGGHHREAPHTPITSSQPTARNCF